MKRKAQCNVTIKFRQEQRFLDNTIGPAQESFLRGRTSCDPCRIVPQLWTNFSRVTLVGLHFDERLTLDLDLAFEADHVHHPLRAQAIVEVKQPELRPGSSAMLVLADLSANCTLAFLQKEMCNLHLDFRKFDVLMRIKHAQILKLLASAVTRIGRHWHNLGRWQKRLPMSFMALFGSRFSRSLGFP